MSRIVTISSAVTFIPNGYEHSGETNTHFVFSSSTHPIEEAYSNANSGGYCSAYLPKTASVVSSMFLNYDLSALSDIPSNATISSMSARSKHRINSTTYVSAVTVQLYTENTAKGSATTARTTSVTVYNLSVGTWTRSELDDMRLLIRCKRASNTRNNAYFYAYGSDVTVNYSYDTTYYAFNCSSTVAGVGISAQDAEVVSGGTNVITLTGVSSPSSISVKDNNVDVTSSLVRSGSNYTYTLNNVNADHTISVEVGLPSYAINVSSTYAGATITANPVSVQEGSNCLLTLTTSDISKVSVVDNGSDITSQFTGSNGTFTYTLTNVITAHTIVVSEVTKKLYMKIDGVMKSVSRIHMKTNNVWTTISFVDFWRKVNGVYVNGEAVSGTTFLMYGGEMESIPEIGTVNKTSSDLTITINDNALESGTYKMFYEDSTRTPLERVDEITEFTIS